MFQVKFQYLYLKHRTIFCMKKVYAGLVATKCLEYRIFRDLLPERRDQIFIKKTNYIKNWDTRCIFLRESHQKFF